MTNFLKGCFFFVGGTGATIKGGQSDGLGNIIFKLSGFVCINLGDLGDVKVNDKFKNFLHYFELLES